jgi:hypothetical protein
LSGNQEIDKTGKKECTVKWNKNRKIRDAKNIICPQKVF